MFDHNNRSSWVCGGNTPSQLHAADVNNGDEIITLCKKRIAIAKIHYGSEEPYELYPYCITCQSRTLGAKDRLVKKVRDHQPIGYSEIVNRASTARRIMEATLRVCIKEGLIEAYRIDGNVHLYRVRE